MNARDLRDRLRGRAPFHSDLQLLIKILDEIVQEEDEQAAIVEEAFQSSMEEQHRYGSGD